jgi:hypothetical protein
VQTIEERIKSALSASGEELWQLLRDPHPEVISNAALNRHFSEEMAVFIAKKKTASPETLAFLAGDVRFKDSYKLKVAVCKNPKTPQRVTFSLLKFMRVFDLADIANDQQIVIAVRQKIEYLLTERMPTIPSGVKMTLARRANSDMLLTLMEDGDERVISTCLDSHSLTESNLCKVINRPATGAAVIKLIAAHPKWSLRYQVKYALIRNFYSPMTCVAKFISGMKTADLKDLYADQKVPTSTKPFIFSELIERGEDVDPVEDEIHILTGDEDLHIADIDKGLE